MLIPSVGYRVAAAGEARIATRDCWELQRYRPSGDANYTPGVDSQGRAVEPADLPGQYPIDLPGSVNVLIKIDLPSSLNLPGGAYAPEARVGVVEVRDSGEVLFNGKPISAGDRERVAVACAEQMPRTNPRQK